MFEIKIIREKITNAELAAMAKNSYGNMVKVVVDLSRGIIAAGGEMHADCEQELLADGSKQQGLWGANIYPDEPIESRIIYDSLINIRPRDNNRTTVVQDEVVRANIKKIIDSLIEDK